MTHRDFKRIERLLSPLTCLAITAAFEHSTAVLAEMLLSDERAQAILGSTEVRSMLLWHAIEESEHRSVAFDVCRSVGGTETKRVRTMRIIRLTFTASVVFSPPFPYSVTPPHTTRSGCSAVWRHCGTRRF